MEYFDFSELLSQHSVTIDNSEFSEPENAYFRVTGTYIHSLATTSNTFRRTKEEFVASRRNALAPFLMLGIEGDDAARKFYEDTRDLYFGFMPDWAKSVIGHDFVQTAKSLLPKYMTGESRASAKYALEHAFLSDSTHSIGCGLDIVQNYTAGLDFASHCDTQREKFTGSFRGATPQEDDVFLCCWGLTHDSALLTEALRRTLPLMLKCVILDDFLTSRNFDFLTQKGLLVSTYDGPWNLYESPQIDRLQRSQSFYESNTSLLPNRQSFLSRAINSRNLEGLFNQITSSSRKLVDISTSETEPILPAVHNISVAQMMKESVFTAIADYCPELNTRSYKRELIKMLAYYPDCALSEMINEIIAGGDPLERLRAKFVKLTENSSEDTASVANQQSLELGNVEVQSNLIDEISVINLALNEHDESPFLSALSALKDPLGKAAVGRLLRRFQLGYPGSSKQIRPRLYEEKIDTGPGYRIYFSRTRGAPIVLLGLGSKATQDADITSAEELLLSFTEVVILTER